MGPVEHADRIRTHVPEGRLEILCVTAAMLRFRSSRACDAIGCRCGAWRLGACELVAVTTVARFFDCLGRVERPTHVRKASDGLAGTDGLVGE